MPIDTSFRSAKVNYPFNGQTTVQEKGIEYTEIINYFHINSSDRDTNVYPKVNSYRINADSYFRNIKSIELVAATLANQNSLLNNPYLILKIDGLNHIVSSNKKIEKSFSTLYIKNGSGPHIQPELGVLQRNVLVFKTPLASLDNFNLQILDSKGDLFNFTEPNGDTTNTYSNSFLLKIITLERSQTDLNFRAVY